MAEIKNPYHKITIANKLLTWFLLVSVLPLIIIGALSYYNFASKLKNDVESNLITLVQNKSLRIETYVKERKRDIVSLSQTPTIFKAFNEFNSIYPNQGIDSPEYVMADKKFRTFLTHFMKTSGCNDFFLISPFGEIMFTVMHKDDFGTNLKTGTYKRSELSKVFERAQTLLETGISDFKYYTASGEEAAFIATPVFKDGRFLGVVAIQVGSDEVIDLVQKDFSLGRTGETILASRVDDHTISVITMERESIVRNNSFVSDLPSSINGAVQGEKGVGVYVDYGGAKVLAAWKYLPHFRWGMVVKTDTSEALSSVYHLTYWYLALGAFTLPGVIFVALLVSRSISRPITKLTMATELMADGDLTVKAEVEKRDEIGNLANTFNDMVSKLLMAKEGNERRNRTQTGQTLLNEKMRGEKDVGTLGNNIISYLTEFFNAQIGALYIMNSKNHLKMIGSYAYEKRKDLSNDFLPGEGIVGQAALEKRHLLITNCPEDYVTIHSSLGKSAPNSILVYPLQMDNEVKGVIELGSFSEFSESDLDFLAQVQEGVAIALNSVSTLEQLSTLLETTQQQSENIKAGDEELRAYNEELETQAKALRLSEENLQTRQAELRASNEELEEQKKRAEKKNVELRAAQRLIEEKAKDLELSSKYKSEFLTNMSHELRTPLNSILLLSRLLADNKDNVLTEDYVESASSIHSSGSELLKLINDILDLSKVEAGKMEVNMGDMYLQDVCDSMVRGFKPLAEEKGLCLKVDIEEGLPPSIRTDQQRVEQIIKNFLSNAFKFTKQGAVTLNICRPTKQKTGYAGEESIVFSVTDTGMGIPKDKQRLIFGAFQQVDGTTSREFGGTGLGLSISRELTNLLGGAIFMESCEGKGSTFSLCLPEKRLLNQDTPLPAPQASNELTGQINKPYEYPHVQPEPAGSTGDPPVEIKDDREEISPDDKSILIISNETKLLNTLCDISRERGFKCLVAEDGKTGLQFANYYKPSAIILDAVLPDISGLAVMARLKESSSTRHIPIDIVSAKDNKLDARKMGAVNYLSKPVSEEDLDQVLNQLNRLISKNVKELLIVEDNVDQVKVLKQCIGNGDVHITVASTAAEAYDHVLTGNFDCMVLDLRLPDTSGVELLSRIRTNENFCHIPIIVYTGKVLTNEEKVIIDQYAESIIVKGIDSDRRLLDETALFLHRVEANLPKEKQEVLRMLRNKEEILSDKKILVVDDDMRNVFSLKKVLESKGMEVVIGKNGREGLEYLDKNSDIDLVLMDIMMPEMDGYEATRGIRKQERFENLPVIALTAKAMKGDRSRCIEAGANDYLAKPLDTDRLFSMLRVWLY
ncbi:MAG: response regulator [Planctomycetes bacterium]|nr:response regulator [Planctomycetota bacterium]